LPQQYTSKIVTLRDIERIRISEDSINFCIIKGLYYLGTEALKFSNSFRESQGLCKLQWNQALYSIGLLHSEDMGRGKVPFGHQGFNNRCNQAKQHMRYQQMAENVAYCSLGYTNVPEVSPDCFYSLLVDCQRVDKF